MWTYSDKGGREEDEGKKCEYLHRVRVAARFLGKLPRGGRVGSHQITLNATKFAISQGDGVAKLACTLVVPKV
jgi:hypothetical protein